MIILQQLIQRKRKKENVRIPVSRANLYIFWCWLYLLLGVSCAGVGFYLWGLASRFEKEAPSGLLVFAGFCVFAGIIRIANSLRVIRNIRRRSQQVSVHSENGSAREPKT